MEIVNFIDIYQENSVVQSLAVELKKNTSHSIQIRGLKGSLDAIIPLAVQKIDKAPIVCILANNEEALYFLSDIEHILSHTKKVFFFPSSYRTAYTPDEIENINILQRTEVMSNILHLPDPDTVIITYSAALTEKIITQQSLQASTLTLRVGQEIPRGTIIDFLQHYNFNKIEFVYEAGQYSIRGGIIDIHSFSENLPYRIEFAGNMIESIRFFDTESQYSEGSLKEANIVPHLHKSIVAPKKQSFLEFIPKNTRIWIKNTQLLLDTIDKSFQETLHIYTEKKEKDPQNALITHPEEFLEKRDVFETLLSRFFCIEFGDTFSLKNALVFQYESQQQDSFQKNFDIITENLQHWKQKGYKTFIASDSPNQLQRLEKIFAEKSPTLQTDPLCISLKSGFIDTLSKVLCYTDHQLFERYHAYTVKHKKYASKSAITLKEIKTLQIGDFVVHSDNGIGRFAGLETMQVGGNTQEVIRLIYKDSDVLYVSVQSLYKISKYSGKDGIAPQMNKLGTPEWEAKKSRIKKRIAEIAKDLIELYAKRKASPGFAFPPDSYLQEELETSFLYQDTPDQASATADVKKDMEKSYPMDRLICGDVGFGKTEIAIRAAFKAVCAGQQVAILVPTTILAMQHHKTFTERLEKFPVTIDYINRFRSKKDVKDIIEKTKEGKVDILIGTHRIINKDIEFKQLGLLVIDEEQKFGVTVKEKLKERKVNVHTLTLTATPIPRTLHFSLMGARDLSIINTPPPNRQPITTEFHPYNEKIIRDAIRYELGRHGQVFFVHNRIEQLPILANTIQRLAPDAAIAVAHGQMKEDSLEELIYQFIEGEKDILVSTNIIENGIDIPNANTIIINQAHMFGLSDLHQMRGRVGRSNKKAFCYLLSPPVDSLSAESKKRLRAIEEFTELGDGFKIAMRDLDIRGAGNILGGEQSGFISDIGFDTYHKLLDETIQELKNNQFAHLFQSEKKEMPTSTGECAIETDWENFIPETYISNATERFQTYALLSNIKNPTELQTFLAGLKDRFGNLPHQVTSLAKTLSIKWKGQQLGVEKIIIKNATLYCYFNNTAENIPPSALALFGKIIDFVKKNPQKAQLKNVKQYTILSINNIKDGNLALQSLEALERL
ncbi:MAG: transcription-repair coupling factor [Chitinophagaceae bacterium]|nr:transcription-repair coupling factor [Chitinophagaceae bacterium]